MGDEAGFKIPHIIQYNYDRITEEILSFVDEFDPKK